MREDQALIQQLCARFYRKPRKCHKINDSNIGSAERIVSINNDTFYYFPKIQEFQDLDFDKLQYVVPKAGVKLNDILQLKFPPRRENERNFFTITLPKNRILKFTKTLKEIIVDEEAEGEQQWTFYFDYDIVALPMREKKLREAQLKEQQNERLKMIEAIKLKQKLEREKIEKINEQINSLHQAQQLRSVGTENEDYLKKRQLMSEHEDVQRRINETDELFFHYYYRKLLTATNERTRAELQLKTLEQVGRFKARAHQTVRQFIDQMAFTPIKFKNGTTYHKNNLKLKFGSKNLNRQFLSNYAVANSIYQMRQSWTKQLRVPLKAMVRYKGFKVLVSAMTPLDYLNQLDYDDAIVHGNSTDNWKIDFLLVENLTIILDHLKLKPYFSEVHYQKVLIHLGSNLKIGKTQEDPYSAIKALDSAAFQESTNYNIFYFFDIDEVFPIDLDFNRSINQQNIRLRPQFVLKYIKGQKAITNLCSGSLTYAADDQEGEKEDISVARASKTLKVQQIVKFVKKLDNLEIIITDSEDLSTAMKQNGINMRYLEKIIKLTQLPYIRTMAEVEAVARVVRQIYRQQQKQFVIQHFRNRQNVAPYISEAFNPRVNPNMRKIRIKQLKQDEDKLSRINSADFLNLMFGTGHQAQAFWDIIKAKVQEKYEFTMKEPQDYHHGYLLLTILYHCGLKVNISEKTKLFINSNPFTPEDIKQFIIRSKVYDFPGMIIHKMINLDGIEEQERIISRLELSLQIKRALGQKEADQLLQLSRYTDKIGPPQQKFTLESFYYCLYHPTADNFETAHMISQVIFPSSHPAIMDLYLQYANIKELDPIILKKAAENHAIRNLGISHWKTSQILSNFKETSYVDHLIKAEAGVEESKKTALYLAIVKQLTKAGKLHESLSYVSRAIRAVEKMVSISAAQQQSYFDILLRGVQNHYRMRTIQQLLRLSQILYNALSKYNIPYTSKWYESMLYYTLKGFLQSSRKKYYLFKLILIFNEKQPEPLTGKQKDDLMQEMGVKWRDSRNLINHIKDMLIKLQFGFTQIHYLPDFFQNFHSHVKRLNNDDFNDALKDYHDFYMTFGFKYFEDSLLENVFAFESHRNAQEFDQ